MDELITDFLTETKESLDILDNQLVSFEQNPNDKNLLGSIFRIMHTIKGTCGFLGLPRLESVAHAGENIMDKIRNNEIIATSNNVSMIMQAIDQIKLLVAHLETAGVEPEGNDKELIDNLNRSAAGEDLSVGNAHAESAPAAVVEAVPAIDPFANIEAQAAAPTPAVATPVEAPVEAPLEAAVESQAPAPEAAMAIEAVAPAPEVAKPHIPEQVKKEVVNKGLEVANAESHDHEKAGAGGTIRVNVNVLENLMQIVSELVLNRNQLLQIDRSVKDNKFTTSIQRLSNITSELQDSVMKTRMQPIKNAWTKFPRLIRDLSMELNKKIKLVMIGEETELDRQLIETIKDPLTHMVRNSADHGLEKPDVRIKNGKDEMGTVTLKAYHQGGHIIVEISDDGRGIDVERIKQKIIQTQLASAEDVAVMTDQQVMMYIFKAGFSTAEKITSVSGRGVGMDVVKTNIESISGTVELTSVVNKGSRFIIKIPLTLAIMPILIVESGSEKFGIPQINVVEMVRAGGSSDHAIEKINGKKLLRLRKDLLPLISLADILNLSIPEDVAIDPSQPVDSDKVKAKKTNSFIVVCEVNGYNFGLVVDKIFDTEEIVVKPVAPILKKIGMYSGNTILGDGQVIMIVDPAGLIKFSNDSGDFSTLEMNLHSNKTDKLFKKEQPSSFLVLKDDNEVEKAIPLELVARLEEIDAKNIEYSNGKRVVQYRGGLMYLTSLNEDFKYPEEGELEVVVFMDKEKTLGLVVKEILDIVDQNIDSNKVLEDSNFNAIIIKNRTMDIVNIQHHFESVFEREFVDHSVKAKKGKHILLIDDSPFFRKFIPPAFIDEGYTVSTAESAVKALELIEAGSMFDLIITDINMPLMSGSEFVSTLRKDTKFQQLPVIALTSNNDEMVREKILVENGFQACISKTNHEDLLSVISKVLNTM